MGLVPSEQADHKGFVVDLGDTPATFLITVILKSENHMEKSHIAIYCGHLFWGRYEGRKTVKHTHKQ